MRKVGGAEWAGPCPFCGGTDRFRAWPGPPGRYWCRRCGAGGDVLQLLREVCRLSFRDALRHAADDLSLTVPAERSIRPPRPPIVIEWRGER